MVNWEREKIIYTAVSIVIAVSFLNVFFVVGLQKKRGSRDDLRYKRCRQLSAKCKRELSGKIVDLSMRLDIDFLLNNQKEDGGFNESYNFIDKKTGQVMNQLSQARALWSLVSAYKVSPSRRLVAPIEKGFAFFNSNARSSSDGKKWIAFQEERTGKTGITAFFIVSIVDLLSSPEGFSADLIKGLRKDLDSYIAFLISLRDENGRFKQYYNPDVGSGFGSPSELADGISLFALCRAARFLNRNDLVPIVMGSADFMYRRIVVEGIRMKRNSKGVKNFFQYGTMSYFELALWGRDFTQKYIHYVKEMADWMSLEYCDEVTYGKIAFAYEGIICGRMAALMVEDRRMAERLLCQADKGLLRFSSWQMGGPVQNQLVKRIETHDRKAKGGILRHQNDSILKIDLVNLHLQALIYAQRFLIKK